MGLGTHKKFETLGVALKGRLDVFFLQETKVLASFFSSHKFHFGFHNCFPVDRAGLDGVLALLWKK